MPAQRLVDLSMFNTHELKTIAQLCCIVVPFPLDQQDELLRIARSLPVEHLRALAAFAVLLSAFGPARRELILEFLVAGEPLLRLEHHQAVM
jgi:hypothetical protein